MPSPSQSLNTIQHQRNFDYTSSPSTSSGNHNHTDNPRTKRGFTNNQTPNAWVDVVKRNTTRIPTSYIPTLPRERRVTHRRPQYSFHNIPTHNRFDRLQDTHNDSNNITNHNHPTHRYNGNHSHRYNGNHSKKVGCYNCGEFNHIRSSCRFDHKLKCGVCQSLGHKSRLCQYYSA